MTQPLEEYFAIVHPFNRASAKARIVYTLPTKVRLQRLSERLPSASRLARQVNKFLALNFSAPNNSTE